MLIVNFLKAASRARAALGQQKGLLQLWTRSGSLRRAACAPESLSALAVRDDGRFVGVGTMFSGSVDIYVAFSLQKLARTKRPPLSVAGTARSASRARAALGQQKGLLQLWTRSGSLRRAACALESLSALAVRDDGRFVGVGTMFSGSVDIYVAFSLQCRGYRTVTILSPPKQKGLLQLWTRSGSLRRAACAPESLSALAVRDDGRFVGVGTMFSGSVDIYVAFSLQVRR
ncbi:uncharacterized protein LOC114350132 [Ostrinia furnacalis]|uniref:uncharacterized protein LOC114350132 n=1 Tax=Ostrinia furnacalis TaxID=93504 RepID=UPI00103CC301|nr:uncharacterized protein LOC114350132 [Ostrinia furnacalis]